MSEYVTDEQMMDEFDAFLQRNFSLDEIDAMMPNSKTLLYKFFSAGYLRGCRYSVELTKKMITDAKQDVQNETT